MRSILLVNPNTSTATTAMMAAVARAALPPGVAVRAVGAARGVAMIVDEAALLASAAEVVRIGVAGAASADAIVVAAFGDPGATQLRAALAIPVIGIGEAAMREAGANGRRFGIATTTPGLVEAIRGKVLHLGLAAGFTGVRVPEGGPEALAADPAWQSAALAEAVSDCMEVDGAGAVVIGGGPLSGTALELRTRFGPAIIEPVPAAVRLLLGLDSPEHRARRKS